jgi:hypothetical protein
MNLIQALTDGTVEFKDNGVIIKHPPSSIMLHAARALKQLEEINQTNAITINSLTVQNQLLLQDLETLNNAYDKLLESTRPVPKHTDDSIRESTSGPKQPKVGPEVSTVECSEPEPTGSN